MATTTAPRHAGPTGRHEAPAGLRATGIVVALTAILAVIFLAFALPAARSKPHQLPIGVAGPPQVTQQVATQLEASAPGGFAITTYTDDTALREAIRNRDVYGGVVLAPTGPTLLTATGASPAAAGVLNQVGTALATRAEMPLRVEDLAPLPARDPRGGGLAASALPLTLAGLLPAAILLLAFPNRIWLRLAALVAAAVVAAATIALLLTYALGSIDDNLLGVTAGLTLGVLATGLTLLGLGSLFGRIGLAAGSAVAVLVGNPLSGLASAPQMLPGGWGTFGQLLPQGANATLLRATAFFDGAGASPAILVLTCWALTGTALIIIAGVRNRA